ncbi:serine hydrolase domain-containing protein [Flagellimonas crocea]|uniref:serine hydrolase domain-containing protein n=1 Tax=Flagellimonas crocea TaxID=3067311 RepID=UPI00296F2921|nr:serine hydrolase domain-containing protein [Muricauda sp. DH64]
MKSWILPTILLIGSFFCNAQSFNYEKLDKYFDLLEANDKFMGSVAVSKGGELIYTRSVGYCNLAEDAKADISSKYRIGSISKTFTTVLVFKAIEAGKLSLDQTLDDFFPEVPNSEKITIKQLLGHRSGIHNITDDAKYMEYYTQPQAQEQLLDIIVTAGSDFEPGSKAQYSNSNFILLTFILEKSMSDSYPNLLRSFITEPLGLSNTYVGSKIGTNSNECKSYINLGTWQEQPETDLSIPLGAGAVVSTPVDIVKFSDALFGGNLLKTEYVELMKTKQDAYGFGLFSFPYRGRTSYGHTGGIDGFSSLFGHFDDGNISFAMTSNGANMNTNDIAITILSTVYNDPFEMPEFNNYEVTLDQLEAYVGTYASPGFPLDLDIKIVDGELKGQATGQPAFPLEAIAEHQFEFKPAKITITFKPEENSMLFEQMGASYQLVKK